MPTISELFVYPIKSCAGIALNAARLLDTGLEYDRCWMVTDPSGAMLTQRAYPRMALIKVELGEHELVIRAPGMSELRTPLDAAALSAPQKVQTEVWRDAAYGLDTGEGERRLVFSVSRCAVAAAALQSGTRADCRSGLHR